MPAVAEFRGENAAERQWNDGMHQNAVKNMNARKGKRGNSIGNKNNW